MSKAVHPAPRQSAAVGNTRGARPAQWAEASAVPPAVDLDMDDAVPYLVTRAGTRMGQAFSKQLKSFNLNLGEWRVCASLHHKPHQRLSELALNTSAEPSTLSRTVDAMIQRKLLVRDRSDEDARAVALSLTPEGLELTRHVIPMAELYERVALAGIPKQQVENLKAMLRKIFDNVAMLDSDE